MCRGPIYTPQMQYWVIYVKSGLVGYTYAPSQETALAMSSAILAFTGIPPQAVFVEPIGTRLFLTLEVGVC